MVKNVGLDNIWVGSCSFPSLPLFSSFPRPRILEEPNLPQRPASAIFILIRFSLIAFCFQPHKPSTGIPPWKGQVRSSGPFGHSQFVQMQMLLRGFCHPWADSTGPTSTSHFPVTPVTAMTSGAGGTAMSQTHQEHRHDEVVDAI